MSIAREGSCPTRKEDAEAVTGKGAPGGGSGVSVRSSSQIVPSPPLPAVTANSRAAKRRISPPPEGPQAKLICRFLIRTSRHSRGNSKSRRTDHQTSAPPSARSLNSRWLVGASPLT